MLPLMKMIIRTHNSTLIGCASSFALFSGKRSLCWIWSSCRGNTCTMIDEKPLSGHGEAYVPSSGLPDARRAGLCESGNVVGDRACFFLPRAQRVVGRNRDSTPTRPLERKDVCNESGAGRALCSIIRESSPQASRYLSCSRCES